MTTIIAISDTHNRLHEVEVPEGDILIHAGDATDMGKPRELDKFILDMSRLPHKHKIFVAGNHDYILDSEYYYLARQQLALAGITYLEGTGVKIKGLEIWGSPIQPYFCGMAFNANHEKRASYWTNIPRELDILVTHCPPRCIRDGVPRKNGIVENTGDQFLAHEVFKTKTKLHVFGHIHCQYGQSTIQGIQFVNAALADEHNQIVNEPIVIEL